MTIELSGQDHRSNRFFRQEGLRGLPRAGEIAQMGRRGARPRSMPTEEAQVRTFGIVISALVLLAGCNSEGGERGATDPDKQGRVPGFVAVGAEEVLHLTGTEPFWGGKVTGETLTYTTPDRPEGDVIAVRRFHGNNGMGLSGELGGRGLDMAVTVAPCSDGMSDRTYPFTVSLRIGGEERSGCGWTDRHKFTGPARP
jgi:uncharacterized membrane protein